MLGVDAGIGSGQDDMLQVPEFLPIRISLYGCEYQSYNGQQGVPGLSSPLVPRIRHYSQVFVIGSLKENLNRIQKFTATPIKY